MSRADYPVYLQLRDRLWEWIEQENLSGQQKLPSERELSERFGTTRVTVRQALSQLEAEGLIFRSNRRGWYVTPERLRYDPSRDVGFNQYVTEQGCLPRTETLFKELAETPAWLSEISGLPVGTPIYHVFRRRYVNERSLLVEHNFINPAKCPGLLAENTDKSIWQMLKSEYKLVPDHREIEIYPLALKGLEAESLSVNQGAAGLYIQRLSFDQDGEFLELDREYWLHDALKISVQVGSRH